MKKINSIHYGGKVIGIGLLFLLLIPAALFFLNLILRLYAIKVIQIISIAIGLMIEAVISIHLVIELKQDRIINDYYCKNQSSNLTPQQILDEHKCKRLWRFPLWISIIALVAGVLFFVHLCMLQ